VKRRLIFALICVVQVLLVSCDHKPSEEPVAEVKETSEQKTDFEAPSAELVIEAPEVAPPAETEPSGPPIDPKNVAGSYRDPSVPELVYELHPGNTFTATWQAADGSRGLRIEGLYQVERGEVVYLMGLNFLRKSSFLGGFDDSRVPTRKPKCYFRIEANQLNMIPDKTDAPFKVAPFTSTRLSRMPD
jgi:hypothetical protein